MDKILTFIENNTFVFFKFILETFVIIFVSYHIIHINKHIKKLKETEKNIQYQLDSFHSDITNKLEHNHSNHEQFSEDLKEIRFIIKRMIVLDE